MIVRMDQYAEARSNDDTEPADLLRALEDRVSVLGLAVAKVHDEILSLKRVTGQRHADRMHFAGAAMRSAVP